MLYRVVVADNFHYMDESENYTLGTFDSLDAALSAAKSVVDEYLASAYEPGMNSSSLYASYTSFGDDPFVVSSEAEKCSFSAWEYALQRCKELCQDQDSP